MRKHGPRETVYDNEIEPLMAKIIEICERAGIPVVASFQLDDHALGDPVFCTTAIVGEKDATALHWCQQILTKGQRDL